MTREFASTVFVCLFRGATIAVLELGAERDAFWNGARSKIFPCELIKRVAGR